MDGSYKMYSIKSAKVISRDKWIALPMPSDVIAHLNSLADRDLQTWASLDFDDDPSPTEEPIPKSSLTEVPKPLANPPSAEEPSDNHLDPRDIVEEDPANDGGEFEDLGGTAVENNSNILSKVSTAAPPTTTPFPAGNQVGRYNLRSSSSSTRTRFDQSGAIIIDAPVDLAFHMTISQAMKEDPSKDLQAMISELDAMLKLKVWSPTLRSLLLKGARIIRSSMFMKKEYDAAGIFLKWKARLVAGGDQQDKHHYDIENEVSSPTISMTALFILACIAVHQGWVVATIDFASAYLHAVLKNTVYMILAPIIASLIVRLDPSASEFLQEDGSMIVGLIKALYGCLESGKLWYDLLSSSLIELGFTMNWYDRCVFNKGTGEDTITVGIFVDDLFIIAKLMSTIRTLYSQLAEKFVNITMNIGPNVSYLGMNFKFTPGSCVVSMEGFVQEFLRDHPPHGKSPSPAAENLRDVDDSPPLDSDGKSTFHIITAKLLYLAKRVRPDLLVAISYLTTRVQHPNESDQTKLERVINYLSSTQDDHILLAPPQDESLRVTAYVDASYCAHVDGKGHTGCVITLGGGPIYCRSTKQKSSSKSSTEAELIALADSTSRVMWCIFFLEEQGYPTPPGVINRHIMYQDNQSTIAMVKNGHPKAERSLHILAQGCAR
jgi:hypothetical protein